MPGGTLCDHAGRARVLPRYFYEMPTWEQARARICPPLHALGIHPDRRSRGGPAPRFPAVRPVRNDSAGVRLEQLREAVGTYVHIAANGGYCSPRHSERARRPAQLGHGGQHLSNRRHVSRHPEAIGDTARSPTRRFPRRGHVRSASNARDGRSSAHRFRLHVVDAARRAGRKLQLEACGEPL